MSTFCVSLSIYLYTFSCFCMGLEEKIDQILLSVSKQNNKNGESQEDPDEKRFKEVEKEVSEIMDLIESQDTRDSLEKRYLELQKHIENDHQEKTPLLRIFHTTPSGKRINIHRRNAHLIDMDHVMKRMQLAKKYPKDLDHMLHIRIEEKLQLMHKLEKKEKKSDKH
jgi:hypothetical protein